jgi:predicted RNA-binding Zn-ribbon protein involved in translation (DUF1610 family)
MSDVCNWTWTNHKVYGKSYWVADCGFQTPSIVTENCPKCGKKIKVVE